MADVLELQHPPVPGL